MQTFEQILEVQICNDAEAQLYAASEATEGILVVSYDKPRSCTIKTNDSEETKHCKIANSLQ